MKYKLVKSRPLPSRYFYRIKALKSFGDVKKGTLGGFVESERNLSQEGNCWIYDNATVYDNALISGNAKVSGDALISGNAKVSGNAEVSGDTRVLGDANLTSGVYTSGVYTGQKANENLDILNKINKVLKED